jgi:hypothetical protein
VKKLTWKSGKDWQGKMAYEAGEYLIDWHPTRGYSLSFGSSIIADGTIASLKKLAEKNRKQRTRKASGEPWQMPFETWFQTQIGKKSTDSFGRVMYVTEGRGAAANADRRVHGYAHRTHVAQALRAGKKVPTEVLEEYPTLSDEVEGRMSTEAALRKMKPGTMIYTVRRGFQGDEREMVEFRKIDPDGVHVLIKHADWKGRMKTERYPTHMIEVK